MSTQQNSRFWKWLIAGFLVIMMAGSSFMGCATAPRMLDSSVTGPQVVVNPEKIRLSVAKLKSTNFFFEGSGFQPGDSVLINLVGPDGTKVIVGEAPVKADGKFLAKVNDLTKFMEIMKGDVSFNDQLLPVVIIKQAPIPAGIYTVKVSSMIASLAAETKLKVKGPGALGCLMDWIGIKTGKIVDKRS